MAALVLVLVALAAPGAGAQTTTTPAESAGPEASAPRIESALLTEMNRARAQRGRAPLRSIATLQRPARAQSRYLESTGILDHDGSDGSPFWARLLAAGFPRGRTLGENLALVPGCNADAAHRTVQLWLDSPGHRANLLNPRFHWVGAGAASAEDCSATVLTADYGS